MRGKDLVSLTWMLTTLWWISVTAAYGGGRVAGGWRIDPGIFVDPTADPLHNGEVVLARYADAVGISDRDLVPEIVRVGKGAFHVRFRQYYRDVPVAFAYLGIHYDRQGRVQLIEDRTIGGLRLSVEPEIPATEALAVARRAIAIVREERGRPKIALRIDPRIGKGRLVWEIHWPTLEPLGDWHLLIDAKRGRVIDRWNELFFDRAFVYDPNAVQATNDPTLSDEENADTPSLTDARVEISLLGLSGNRLVGPFVDLCATGITGAYKPACQASDPDGTPPYTFDFTRSDDRFEEGIVYHAIDGVQRYIQETLGFASVNNRSIPAHAHYYDSDNAFYSSDDKGLHFGDGGVDDAEDADVILHEYGHAILDDQVPGWGIGFRTEQRAIGEGFGDFLAGMFNLDRGSSAYQETQDRWAAIAEWDAVSYGTPVRGTTALRWIDGTDETTGEDIGAYSGKPGEVHDDGRYWSAMLTCIFQDLGREATLELALESHFYLLPDMSDQAFENAVSAMILADETLNGGANRERIAECAMARNLIECVPLPAPSFLAPAGGERHQAGEEVTIAWNREGIPDEATFSIDFTDRCDPFFFDDMEGERSGWSVSHGAGLNDWMPVSTRFHSPSHAFFAAGSDRVSDQYLVLEPFTVPADAHLRFHHFYDLEEGFDGGVIEFSIDGGPFEDAGLMIEENGYPGTIVPNTWSPIGGRGAFTGESHGFIETVVDLSAFAGHRLSLRFRMASDRILASEGWYVDDIEVTDGTWRPVVAQTAPGATSLGWRLPEVESEAACFRISMMAGECERTPGVRSAPFVILSGDPQDADGDGDGVPDSNDDCPEDANPDQADADGDGVGDVCDPCPADNPDDPDGDGVCQGSDNCPEDANPDQADLDGDGVGDVCDPEVTCALFPEFLTDRYARCAMILLLLLVSPVLLGVSRRTRPAVH